MGPFGRPYGQGAVVVFNLLDYAAGQDFESAPTFQAADCKVVSDEQAPANAAAVSVALTSGSEKPRKGQEIEGNTSGATAVVVGVGPLTGGTWGGGDAACTLFVEQKSGTFQSETLKNNTTGTADVGTIGGDITGLAIIAAGTTIAAAFTSSELSAEWARMQIVDDAGGPVWLPGGLTVETTSHPHALHRPEGNGYVLAQGVVGGTGNSATQVHADGLGVGADEYAEHQIMLQDTSTGEWHSRFIESHTAFDDGSFPDRITIDSNQADLPFTPVAGDLWFVLAPRRDGTPAALGGQAKNDALESASSAIGQVFSAADSEPSSVPAANATPLEKLAWIFTVLRNKITNDGSTQTVRNDADGADIGSASVSQVGGTVTRGKYS